MKLNNDLSESSEDADPILEIAVFHWFHKGLAQNGRPALNDFPRRASRAGISFVFPLCFEYGSNFREPLKGFP